MSKINRISSPDVRLCERRGCELETSTFAKPHIGAWVIVLLALAPASPYASREYDLIREGNEQLKRNKPDEAMKYYDRAEEKTEDPGLVAFNKATAFYQKNEFRQAERHYRMTLDDEQIPEQRRARALYNLGNCLVKQAGDRDQALFRDAVRCYELCLDGSPDDKLREQASLNLELAKLLWLKARQGAARKPAPNSEEKDERPPPEPKKKEEKRKNEPGADKNMAKGKLTPAENPDGKGQETKDLPKANTTAKPARSRVPVIPDRADLQRLSPEDTAAALQVAEERLRKMRQQHRANLSTPEVPSGRDW